MGAGGRSSQWGRRPGGASTRSTQPLLLSLRCCQSQVRALCSPELLHPFHCLCWGQKGVCTHFISTWLIRHLQPDSSFQQKAEPEGSTVGLRANGPKLSKTQKRARFGGLPQSPSAAAPVAAPGAPRVLGLGTGTGTGMGPGTSGCFPINVSWRGG